MTKLCPRGKAAAKRKFKVYPSAYANAYASKICAGKIKDPSGVKRKDFRGPKPAAKGAMMKAKKGKAVMIIIGVGKKKKVQKKMGGGMTAGSQSAMGRLQKARMMNEGGISKLEAIGQRKKALDITKRSMDILKKRAKRDKSRLTQSDMERAKRVQMKNEGGVSKAYAIAQRNKSKDRLTESDIKKAKELIKKNTPIGEMQGRDKARKVKKKLKNISNQVKGFGKEMLGFDKGGDAKIKKVITGLNKASALHKSQAKSLQTVVGKSVGGMADYYKDLM